MEFDTLQRQVDEIEALLSVYAEEGAISFSVSEADLLKRARELLEAPQSCMADDAVRLSGCIQLPEVQVEGSAVTIKFTLPTEYPTVKPSLQLIANAPREQLDELSAELEECVAEHEGSECLLLCVGHMLAEIIDRLNSGLLSSTDTIAAARASVVQSMGPCTLSRTIVWFHHIASPKKRRAMSAWSSDLKVGGYSKIGYPGVLILEGERSSVEEYVVRLRSLRWKAMAVRGEQQVEFGGAEEAEAARVLPQRVVELTEGQLGDMGEMCRGAGLERLFLLALKIERHEPSDCSSNQPALGP